MSQGQRVGGILLRLTFIIFFSVSLLYAQKPAVRIGVVVDGPSNFTEDAISKFEQEITIVLEDEYEVSFPPEKRFSGNWTGQSIDSFIDRLMADADVDMVLALGFISSHEIARRSSLSKPVFAPYVAQASIQGIPIVKRQLTPPPPERPIQYSVSGVKNLSYLERGIEFSSEARQFMEVVPFSRLVVLMTKGWQETFPDIPSLEQQLAKELQIESVSILGIGSDIRQILAQIPPDADAVFISPTPFLDIEERKQLAEGLIQKGLPSFSSVGQSDVEIGFLAGSRLEEYTLRRARRTAIQMQEVLEGAEAGELSVTFDREDRLTINMATARAINLSPRFSTLLKAELVNEEITQAARSVSLSSVVREASVTNLDLAAADRFVAAGEDQVRESRAPLLPQVGLGGDITFRDPDTAELLPIFGKREYNANLSFRQQIYSENDWAAYSIEKSLLDRKMSERAQIRLDVILEAAQSYLEVLRTKSIERIQKENLQLTRENLALARSRVEIGIAGREELFRWEDEIATNQRTVVEYEALRRQAELALNRVLNHPLDEKFLTIEAALNDPELVASFEALTPYIESPRAFQLFNAFMVNEAFTASPEIRQLESLLRAKERERDAAKRSFFLPEFFLQGGFSWFDRVRAGDLDLNLPELNKTWEISVNANLPLFQGAGRWARVSRTNNEIQELTLRQDATRQRVEQRIRSILQRTNASFIGIDLANASSAAAEKNLELVSDSYAQGVIGILALLDAQNRALVAKQAAANAIFTYLIDLMGVQRAVGRFDYYRSPQERQEFLSRLRQFYQENGFSIRTP